LVPLARDDARFKAVRSLISPRLYSAREPTTPIIIQPAGVDEVARHHLYEVLIAR
jgi:hypothetical protein